MPSNQKPIPREVRAIFWLILSIIGVPTIPGIFREIFKDIIKSVNLLGIIGYITASILVIVSTLNLIAVSLRYENLGEWLEDLEK